MSNKPELYVVCMLCAETLRLYSERVAGICVGCEDEQAQDREEDYWDGRMNCGCCRCCGCDCDYGENDYAYEGENE